MNIYPTPKIENWGHALFPQQKLFLEGSSLISHNAALVVPSTHFLKRWRHHIDQTRIETRTLFGAETILDSPLLPLCIQMLIIIFIFSTTQWTGGFQVPRVGQGHKEAQVHQNAHLVLVVWLHPIHHSGSGRDCPGWPIPDFALAIVTGIICYGNMIFCIKGKMSRVRVFHQEICYEHSFPTRVQSKLTPSWFNSILVSSSRIRAKQDSWPKKR